MGPGGREPAVRRLGAGPAHGPGGRAAARRGEGEARRQLDPRRTRPSRRHSAGGFSSPSGATWTACPGPAASPSRGSAGRAGACGSTLQSAGTPWAWSTDCKAGPFPPPSVILGRAPHENSQHPQPCPWAGDARAFQLPYGRRLPHRVLGPGPAGRRACGSQLPLRPERLLCPDLLPSRARTGPSPWASAAGR